MARYIDADKAMEEVNQIGGHNLCDWSTIGVKALIDRQPTADVVPKSEVEKIFEEIEALRLKHTYGEIDEADLNIGLYELKKKYTERKT